MDQNAQPADKRKERKPRWHQVTESAIIEHHQKLDRGWRIQLAFSFFTATENERDFVHTNVLRPGENQIEQDLEAASTEPWNECAKVRGS